MNSILRQSTYPKDSAADSSDDEWVSTGLKPVLQEVVQQDCGDPQYTWSGKHLARARKASLRSVGEYRLGCVISRRAKVLAEGFNDMRKTHPRCQNPYQTLHAEVRAIIELSKDELRGSDCHVYRQHKSGEPALARPCPACEMALRVHGIKRCFFTTGGRNEDGSPAFAVLEFG